MYIKEGPNGKILLVEIFVVDFSITGHDDLCKAFFEAMRKEFEMSMFGEIKFFVVLQIHQMKDGIYITQSKYIEEILNTFGMEDSRPIGTPMSTRHKLSKDGDSKEVN